MEYFNDNTKQSDFPTDLRLQRPRIDISLTINCASAG